MIIKQLSKKLCLSVLANTLISTSCLASGLNDAFSIFNALGNRNTKTQVSQQQAYNTIPTAPKPREVVYTGYSQDFLDIKKLINEQNFTQAYQIQADKVNQAEIADFLNSNEAGLLALDINQPTSAIEHFAAAEHFLKINAAKSIVEDAAFAWGSETIGILTGVDGLADYNGAPFERILMLNYKSIAYLLNGERKAYNVTRRAIDWQNIEQKEFEQNIELVEQNIEEETSKLNDSESGGDTSAGATNIFSLIKEQYKSSEKTALSIPSAYVNPFGFYIAGIVQEFDSFEDPSLRDNARISYKKALKLNPNSKVIKQAIKEVPKRLRRGKRLVQIIIADGYAPEKKMLQFSLPMPGGIVPVKLPIYEPVSSKVAHIRIKLGKKTLATASTIANIEAIVLRYQLDSLPFQHFKVVASITRSSVENLAWGKLGVFGQIGKDWRESFANPDMRSWLSLPKQLLAARFYASKRLKKITIVSYDKNWVRLATQKVTLPKNEHTIIYARTIDNILNTNINKTLWVKTK